MPSFSYELRYLEAGADILGNFLLSPEIYWPLGISAPAGETPYPQLTLGNLELSRLRASVLANNSEEQEQLARVNEKFKQVHKQWQVAWENKATHEIRSRLTQWRNFLEDYRDNSAANYDRYFYDVFRRVICQILTPEAGGLSKADAEMISGLDGLLSLLLIKGDFVWEPQLKSAFPETDFWYLYGRLPKERPL
jgi:hypothetical protein